MNLKHEGREGGQMVVGSGDGMIQKLFASFVLCLLANATTTTKFFGHIDSEYQSISARYKVVRLSNLES